MPIRKVGNKYQWGQHGKLYSTRAAAEKQAAAAYANGYTGDERIKGAGICIVAAQTGRALFIKRSPDSNHPNEWDLPGGRADNNETPEQTAKRETLEEIGALPYGELKLLSDVKDLENVDFITYRLDTLREFKPKLQLSEHTAYVWAPLDTPPQPLHQGVKITVEAMAEDYVSTGEGVAKEYSSPIENSKVSNETVENTKVHGSAPNYKRNESTDASDAAFALDRRTVDIDGKMHVELTNISMAAVNPYLGKEIPDYVELGLIPNQVYMLLRDPAELEKAVESCNNMQLLETHEPVNAGEPRRDLTIGSTGTDGVFEHPYLKNSLVIWDAGAIARIENKETQELSCGYRYKPVMTPGIYEGVAYDGVMTEIVMNHIALVSVGRAGKDVCVGDSGSTTLSNHGETKMSKHLSKKAALVKGVVLAVLKPKLAADKMPDLDTILAGVTKKNWLEKKASIAAALAKDADMEQLVELLDSLDDQAPSDDDLSVDEDPAEEVLAMLRGKISDEDLAIVAEKIKSLTPAAEPVAADEPPAFEGKPEVGGEKDDKVSKPAMDAAIKEAVKLAVSRVNEVHEARKVVAPFVGELVIAADSAADVYKAALVNLGVSVTGIHHSAYRAILEAQTKPGEVRRTAIAVDSASVSGYAEFAKSHGLSV